MLVDDFIQLDSSRLRNNFSFKQILKFPTRDPRTLDLFLTNLYTFYKDPIQRPPQGLSDHMSVKVKPKDSPHHPKQRCTIKSNNLRPSNRFAMRAYLLNVDVNAQIGTVHASADKVSVL